VGAVRGGCGGVHHTAGDGNRLRRVLEESVVAFEHGRMQADLGRQLAALRDSRARLIAAGDTERRRIERDIHDGARRTVETHINGVFTKLRLAPTEDDHRRVQAVLTYLRKDP
jgi:hypothetical protein